MNKSVNHLISSSSSSSSSFLPDSNRLITFLSLSYSIHLSLLFLWFPSLYRFLLFHRLISPSFFLGLSFEFSTDKAMIFFGHTSLSWTFDFHLTTCSLSSSSKEQIRGRRVCLLSFFMLFKTRKGIDSTSENAVGKKKTSRTNDFEVEREYSATLSIGITYWLCGRWI